MAVLKSFKAARPVHGFEDRILKENKKDISVKQTVQDGNFMVESKPMLYIYSQIVNGDQKLKQHVQTGIICCISKEAFDRGIVKSYEEARKSLVESIKHRITLCESNGEPVLAAYKDNNQVKTLIDGYMKNNAPDYDFEDEEQIIHRSWAITDDNVINGIIGLFDKMESLYIVDGYEKAAACIEKGCDEFLAAVYPDSEIRLFESNRVVRDLNGNSIPEFIDKIKSAGFSVEDMGEESYCPDGKQRFGMFLNGRWYKLIAGKEIVCQSEKGNFDVCILHENILAPILGINDAASDDRLDFVEGTKGRAELERRTQSDMSVAFFIYPMDTKDVINAIDSGIKLPAEATWMEPRPCSGLFVQML